jgi:hypothetical protein
VSLPDSGQRLVCNTPLLTFGASIFTSNGHPAQADHSLAPQGRERSSAAYTLSSHCYSTPPSVHDRLLQQRRRSRLPPPTTLHRFLPKSVPGYRRHQLHQAPSSMPRVAINVSSLSFVQSMLTLVIPARHLLATPITHDLNGIRPIQTPRADRAWYRHRPSPLPAQSRGLAIDDGALRSAVGNDGVTEAPRSTPLEA